MKTKRILALALSVLLMLTMFSTTGFAEFIYNDDVLTSGTDDSTVPTLSLELFDKDYNKTNVDTVKTKPTENFFIGIKATNFDRFKAMAVNGVTNLYIPFNFNAAVFQKEPNVRGGNVTDSTVKDRVTSYAKSHGLTVTFDGDSNTYAASLFDAPGDTSIKIAPSPYKMTLSSGSGSNSMSTIQVLLGPAGDDSREAGLMYATEYLAFFEMKLQSTASYDSIAEGTLSFGFETESTDRISLRIGVSGADTLNKGYNAESRLQDYLKLDTSAVDFFPAGQVKLTGIANNSSTIADQYVGSALNKTGLSITATYSDSTTKTIDATNNADEWANVTFGYANTNDVDNADNLTKITGNLPALSNQYLYAIYNGKVASLGQFSTTAVSVSKINSVTHGVSAAYNDKAVTFGDSFSVNVDYNNGSTNQTISKYSALASKGLAVYAVDAAGKLTTTLGNYKNGTNTFYVAETGQAGQTPTEGNMCKKFEITSSANSVSSVTNASGPSGKTYGDTINRSDFKLSVTMSNGDKYGGNGATAFSDAIATATGLKLFKNGTEVTSTDKYDAGENTFTIGTDTNKTMATVKVNAAQKTVTLTVTGTVTKTYDGTNATTGAGVTNTLAYSVDSAGLVSGDSAPTDINATAVYSSVNASTSDIAITISNPTSSNASFNKNYKFSTTMPTNVKGKINPIDVDLSSFTIDNVPAYNIGTTTNLSATHSIAVTGNGILSGENVTLNYTYAYAQSDVDNETQAPTVTISNTSLSSTNYNLTGAPTSATGSIIAKPVNSISLNKTAIEYTYPTTDTAALAELTVTTDGGDNVALSECTLTIGGNAYAAPAYGDAAVTVTVTYAEKTATFTLKANKKMLTLSKANFEIDNPVEGTPSITSTNVDGLAIEAGDTVEIDTAGITLTKDGTKVTISGIALTGADAGKYDVAATLEVDVDASKADQAAPTGFSFTFDNKTNKLVITAPTSTGYGDVLYSKDGGTTWLSEEDMENAEVTKEEAVSLIAKYAGNNAYNESPNSDPVTGTAYKYSIDLIAASGKKLTAQYFFNIEEGDAPIVAADGKDLVTRIMGTKEPSRVKKYYYLADGAETEIANYTVTGDWEVFYTVSAGTRPSSGGGGSAVVTYKVTYKAGSHGKISADSETVTAGGKPKTLPTVTADEGWKFIGWSQDGETVVDPTTVDIKAASTFTALYEKIKEDEPVIDVNYTKPYASGYPDGTFGPDRNITRAELATMIAKMSFGNDIPSGYVSSFPDVTADKWYSKYIGYLEGLNVLTGYEDGTFQPEKTVTRAEISAVIVRAQKMNLVQMTEGQFSDMETEHWAGSSVATLVAQGIASGYPDGTFAPSNPITRAETVAMINRVLAASTPVVSFTPSDISGHWAEADIILAVNERQVNE